MLETLSKIGQAAKNAVIYILTPFAMVILVIYFLITKNHKLKDELEASKSKEKLNELEGEKKQIDIDANAVVEQYRRNREAYMRGDSEELRSGSGSAAEADRDQGPDAGSGGDTPSS